MAYVPNSTVWICNVTYSDAKDLEDDQRLLRCGRCKEVYYVSVEAQKQDWKTHRKFCCSIEEDESIEGGNFRFLGIEHICQVIAEQASPEALTNLPVKGRRILVHAFQQLRAWCMRPENFDPPVEIKDMIQRQVAMSFHRLMTRSGFENTELVFGIPGFVCHFLDYDLLISPKMLELRSQGQMPPQGFDVILDYDDIVASELQHGPGFHLNPTYGNVISMIQGYIITDQNEQVPLFRSNPLTRKVLNMKVRLCGDAYFQTTYPITNPGDILVLQRQHILFNVFFKVAGGRYQTIETITNEDEVLPGVSLYDFLKAMLADTWINVLYSVNGENSLKELIGMLFRHADRDTLVGGGPWKALSVPHRMDLIFSMFKWSISSEPGLQQFAQNFVNYVIFADTGATLTLERVIRTEILIPAKHAQRLEDVPENVKTVYGFIQQAKKVTLQSKVLPSLTEYTEEMEKLYARQHPDAPSAEATFPTVLFNKIGDYSMPNSLLPRSTRQYFQRMLEDDVAPTVVNVL